MKAFYTLSIGLVLGVLGALLLLRAGVPPVLAALVLWMLAGCIGLSLMQFAFFGPAVERTTKAAEAFSVRSFLLGLLILEIPLLMASTLSLMGAQGLGVLVAVTAFGSVTLAVLPAIVSLQIGGRLMPGESRTRQVTGGSMVAATAILVPVFGWLWLLFLGIRGTGAWCLRNRYA